METSTSLIVPRGVPNLTPLTLDMTKVYIAESRIHETKAVSDITSPELKATFNEANALVSKYIAWVKFEINMAQKYLDLAKAEVILDKLPDRLKEFKEKGIKDNSDLRDALVSQDTNYQDRQNAYFALEAVKLLLEAKAKSFDRAYWDCKGNAEQRSGLGYNSFQVTTGELSSPQSNFMGKSQIK